MTDSSDVAQKEWSERMKISDEMVKLKPYANDLSNMRFGKLIARKPTDMRLGGCIMWECICDCGRNHVASSGNLRAGGTKSCAHCTQQKDGLYKHPLSKIHGSIVFRCHNKKATGYHNYGGRGISVCDEWRHGDGKRTGRECFIDWIERNLGERPAGHSLDRIDNDGDYEPGNVRWASRAQQSQNTRRTKLTIDQVAEIRQSHKTLTNVELAIRYGVNDRTISKIRTGRTWANLQTAAIRAGGKE